MNYSRFLLSTTLLASAFAGQGAMAQTANATGAESTKDNLVLQEIIVTAERRFNTAQKTAAAVSVRPGAEMVRQGRYELKNILEDVPGISGGAAGATNTSLAGGTDNPATGLVIRGIQSNQGVGGSATSTSSAAAIYTDDVYNGVGGNYDIARVEVLRGPQGTLYGRSATAGIVAIHTNDPDTKAFGVEGTAEIANYNLFHFVGAVNVPIVEDKLALRVAGNYFERDGYYATKGDARQSASFRAKLLWTPADNFSALLGYAQEFNTTRTGGTSVVQGSSPTDFVFSDSAIGTGRNHSRQVWGKFNLDLGGIELTYIPAYRTFFQDTTAVVRTGEGVGAIHIDNYVKTTPDNFMTHELRVNSTDTDSPFKWQVGGLYYRNSLSERNDLFNYDIGPTGAFIFKSFTHKVTTAGGVFAEGTYAFAPDTRLTAGIRYDHTNIEIDQDYTTITGVTASLAGADRLAKFNNITYKARLEHDLTPRNMLYALIATGVSPGDKTLTQNFLGQPRTLELAAETLTSYEVGSKNRFLNDRLQINLAAFYNDYGGYQTAGINVAPPGETSRVFEVITVPLKSYGVEFEIQARPWENGTIGLNGSYIRARYGEFPAEYAQYFSSRNVAPSPPFRVTGSYDHRVSLGGDTALMLRGVVRYVSSHASSRITVLDEQLGAGPYVHVPGRAVADFNATLVLNPNVSITGYVRNLTNERYLPDNWNVANTIPGDPATGTPPTVIVSQNALSDPRTFGMILNFKF